MSHGTRIQPAAPDRAAELLSRVEYRLMESCDEREEVYRLRYRAYVQENAIAPNAAERLYDKFDDAPNSWIFGLYVDGELASSLRVSASTPAMPVTPAVDAFPERLGPEVVKGKIIVDPNRFVADPARTSRLPELPYLTVRLGYVACGHFHADIGTATVRKEHQAFYRRVFLQEVWCEPRPYPSLIKPLSLMAAHYPLVRDRIYRRYPYFRSTVEERERLFRTGPQPVSAVPASYDPVPLQPHQD